MGRKTFDSLPRVLDGRDNIVITRQAGFEIEGAFVVKSLEGAVSLARQKANERGGNEVCVIGGAQIYKQILPLTMRIYLTRVHAKPQGDAVFPVFSMNEWREVSRQFHARETGDSADYSIIVLDRA